MTEQLIHISDVGKSYPVRVGANLLATAGDFITQNIRPLPRQIIVFSDEIVFGLYGETLLSSLNSSGFECQYWTIPAGEEQKSLSKVEESLDYFCESGLTRSDLVVAFGGGVVGDIAGFCSAVYMRGVPYLQMPTTLLSMVDSSVGGKTGVNSRHGKNLIGAFNHPEAVLADINVLKTLDKRELRAGFYELVKHGAIGGMDLFNRTNGFLTDYPLDNFEEHFDEPEFEPAVIELISKQIAQKASVVSQDQREDPMRQDAASRKVLNFGHTVGHALERVTDYKYFRHGEAVGYGMLVAMEIAKKLEVCDKNSINLLNDVVLSIGALPETTKIDVDSVHQAIDHDKKSIGKSQQWVLLESIGHPRIVASEDISASIIRDALTEILHT